MNVPERYRLEEAARLRWESRLKALLTRHGHQQKAVAHALEEIEDDGRSKRSEVSRFVQGHPSTLHKWFTHNSAWLQVFSQHVGTDPEGLKQELERARDGRDADDESWHPAFPGVSVADAEIPVPFRGSAGSTADEIVARLFQLAGSPLRWRRSLSIVVYGPPGRWRDLAVRQVARSARAAVARFLEKAAQRVGRASLPVIPVVSLQAGEEPGEAEEDGESRLNGLLIRSREHAGREDEASDLETWLAPWSRAEAVALARRLAASGVLDDSQTQRLDSFAEQLDKPGYLIGPSTTPDLLIRLLAEVARRGPPKDPAEARRMLTAAAWERACQKGEHGPLDHFEEDLLEFFWAGCALRRSSSDEIAPGFWSQVPVPQALSILADAARRTAGVPMQRDLMELVEEARRAGGRQRNEALLSLQRCLAAEPARGLYEALKQGGILEDDGLRMRPVDPALATIWAARGILAANIQTFSGAWERLADPAWDELLVEMALEGLSASRLLGWLDGVPDLFSVDASRWIVRYAATATDRVPLPALRSAWAGTLWAAAHGWLGGPPGQDDEGWSSWMAESLVEVSERYREVLPTFGDDPLHQVCEWVSAPVRRLVDCWWEGTTRDASDSSATSPLAQAMLVSWWTPAQMIPRNHEEWDRWDRWVAHDSERALSLLVGAADRGEPGARAFLSGHLLFDAPVEAAGGGSEVEGAPRESRRLHTSRFRTWGRLPLPLRLDWVISAGPRGDLGLELFHRLEAEAWNPPEEAPDQWEPPMVGRLLALAEALGADCIGPSLEERLLPPFPPYQPVPRLMSVQIAEHLGLVDILVRVARRPRELVPQLHVSLGEGDVLYLGVEGDAGRRRLPTERPSEAIFQVFQEWESLAEQAAVALARRGYGRVLQERWLQGGGWDLPPQLIHDLEIISGLQSLQRTPLDALIHSHPPLQALKAWRDARESVGGGGPDHTARNGGAAPTAWLQVQAIGPDRVSPELRDLAEMVRTLCTGRLDGDHVEIDEWLSGMGDPVLTGKTSAALQALSEAIRVRAVRHLLLLGETAPVQAWTRNAPGPVTPSRDPMATIQVAGVAARIWTEVERHLVQSTHSMDLAWSWLPENQASHRRWLLDVASLGPGRDEDSSIALPRPWVIREALNTRDRGLARELAERNQASRQILPVLRRLMQDAPDPKDKACWARRIHQHLPRSRELNETLESWLMQDPDPLSGGERFHWEGNHYDGGAMDLLEALDEVPQAPWMIEGIRRLWHLVTTLPIDTRFEPPLEGEPTALWCPLQEAPRLLRELMARLEAVGCPDVVLDTWYHPPRPQPGDAEALVRRPGFKDRAALFAFWLRRFWLKHASTAQLASALDTDCQPDILLTLEERGWPGLLDAVEKAVRTWGEPPIGILVRLGPDRLLPSIRARSDQPDFDLRPILRDLMEVANHPDTAHVAALVFVREVLDRRSDKTKKA